jgi:hypothetical protein
MAKEKNYYTVIEEGNWADEIDYAGITLMESDVDSATEFKDKLLDGIEKSHGDYPLSANIGSNEEVEVGSRDELSGQIRVVKISKEQLDFLKEIFQYTKFGVRAFT